MLLTVWLLFQMPMYTGPSRFVTIASLNEFDFNVLYGEHTWCVLFFAPWSDSCVTTMPLWAEMSLEFTTEKLVFGLVNVQKAPGIAERCGVDVSGFSSQLPSLILYENGVE